MTSLQVLDFMINMTFWLGIAGVILAIVLGFVKYVIKADCYDVTGLNDKEVK